MAVFPTRGTEPKELGPYEDLLRSSRVRRIYLDECPVQADPPLSLAILGLFSAPLAQLKDMVVRLLRRAHEEFSGTDVGVKTIELVEEFLMRRFSQLSREEIRAMFQLEDLRKTRVWQEARAEGHQEGRQEGRQEERQEFVQKLLAKGMPIKEIAALLETSVQEVRRLSKNGRR